MTELSAREIEGIQRSDARFKRKSAKLADALADQVVKTASLRHELGRLEDVLAWIHHTQQPIEDIRTVIERTIPRRLGRK